jgi:hypothetical protein
MSVLATARIHVYQRRWAISAVIVVLAHAAIIAAVATWRTMIYQRDQLGPVMIELAPRSDSPRQSAIPSTPLVVNPSSESPAAKMDNAREEKTGVAKRDDEVASRQLEESSREVSPMGSTRPAGSNQKDEAAGRDAIGGGSRAGSQGNPIGTSPIETNIADFGPRSRKQATINRKKMIFTPLPGSVGERQRPRALGWAARNAIGMRTQDHASATGAHADLAATQPNALGLVDGNAVGAGATTVANGAARNALGIITVQSSRPVQANVITRTSGAVVSAASATRKAAITGTGMARPASLTGTIGGAAKNGGGGINGTAIRLKYP